MKTVGAFLAGVAVASAAAALQWAWHSSDDLRRSTQLTVLRARVAALQHDLDAAQARSDALQADADAASRATRTQPAARRAAPPPPAAAPAPAAPEQPTWHATAASALEREVARRFGRTLGAGETAFLAATLGTVRDASRALNDTPPDPTDPAAIREHVAQQEALLAADEIFRNELGVGVSAFVQGLSADRIEEAVPPDPPR